MKVAACFVGLVLASAEMSAAATFNARADSFACSDVQQAFEGVTAQCPRSFAFSEPGWLGARAGSGYEDLGQAIILTLGPAEAWASFDDTLYFGVSRGTFTIPIQFLGHTQQSVAAEPLASYSRAFSLIMTNGNAGDASGSGVDVRLTYLSSMEVTKLGDTYTYISSEIGDAEVFEDLVLDIVDGRVSVRANLQLSARCDVAVIAYCHAFNDYSNSLRFLGGTLRDLDGNILDDVSVTSDSGFDYRVGRPPHENNVGVVPLPATVWLLGAGLLGLFGLRRRADPRRSSGQDLARRWSLPH